MTFISCVIEMCEMHTYEMVKRDPSLLKTISPFLRGTGLTPDTFVCLKHGVVHKCDEINCIMIGDTCVVGSTKGGANNRNVVRPTSTMERSSSGETDGLRCYDAGNKAKNCQELLDYLKKTYQFQNVSNTLKDFVAEEKLMVGGHILQSIIQRLYALIHVHLYADIQSMSADGVLSSAKERDSIMLNLVGEELSRKDLNSCPKKHISENKHVDFAKYVSSVITHDLTCSSHQLSAPVATYRYTHKAFGRPKLPPFASNDRQTDPQL